MLRLSLRNVLGPQGPLPADHPRRRDGRRLRRRLVRRHRLAPGGRSTSSSRTSPPVSTCRSAPRRTSTAARHRRAERPGAGRRWSTRSAAVEGVDAAEAVRSVATRSWSTSTASRSRPPAPRSSACRGATRTRLRPATLDEGRAPDGLGEVAIDRGTAADYGFSVGDHTTVLLADGTQPEVGDRRHLHLRRGQQPPRCPPDRVRRRRRRRGVRHRRRGRQHRHRGAPTACPPSDLAARIQRVLPDGIESVTGTEVAAEGEEGIAGLMDAFRNILLGFAAVALFVSAFFINNTFSIVVGQRTRQLALLRGRRRQRRSDHPVGRRRGARRRSAGLRRRHRVRTPRSRSCLQAISQRRRLRPPRSGPRPRDRTVAAAVVVGLGVTLIASLAPARRASTRAARARHAGGRSPDRPRPGPRRTWSGRPSPLVGAGLVVAGLRSPRRP